MRQENSQLATNREPLLSHTTLFSSYRTLGWKVGRNPKNTLENLLPTSLERLEASWKRLEEFRGDLPTSSNLVGSRLEEVLPLVDGYKMPANLPTFQPPALALSSVVWDICAQGQVSTEIAEISPKFVTNTRSDGFGNVLQKIKFVGSSVVLTWPVRHRRCRLRISVYLSFAEPKRTRKGKATKHRRQSA